MQRLILLFALFFTFNFVHAQQYTLMHDGSVRSYIVHLPTGYTSTGNYPVVLNFHGLTSNASQQQSMTGMNAVSDANKFIVVYPNGLNNSWNAGINNSNVDDVGFINALIDELTRRYSVNTQRVYATGFSMGGYFSYRLACRLSNRIAAIAPVSGVMAYSTTSSCAPVRSVPVMHVHGTNDGIVPYSGAASSLRYWRNHNKCTAAAQTTALPNGVDLTVYGGCAEGSEVRLYRINGAGHTWPRTTINASQEIWKFFSRFTLNSSNTNPAPVINITAPATNTSFTAPANITIAANATDANGTVTKVEFFQGAVKLGEDLTSPYTYSWANVAAGSYNITARATDNLGATTTSASVTVTVSGSGNACSGVSAYSSSYDNYIVGSKVVNYNRLYECKSASRCNGSAWFYAPGVGAYWQYAWTYREACATVNRIATSIEENINVYPNPANDYLEVEFDSPEDSEVNISLAHMLSDSVLKTKHKAKSGPNKLVLDISKLQNGLHILIVSSGNERVTKKVYIER